MRQMFIYMHFTIGSMQTHFIWIPNSERMLYNAFLIIIIIGATTQGGSWPAHDNASIWNGLGRYFSSF
jgi:hypothetical protein